MSEISREKSKEYVEEAIMSLADHTEHTADEANFDYFTEYDKAEFLRNLNKVIHCSGYEIPLESSLPQQWHNIDDCIEYVESHTEKLY